MVNAPDYDDSYSTWIEDKLVELSIQARTERIRHAESILDLPDETITPTDIPTMEAAWDWLWNNDRAVYHREMERAIDNATCYETEMLLERRTEWH